MLRGHELSRVVSEKRHVLQCGGHKSYSALPYQTVSGRKSAMAMLSIQTAT